MACGLLSAFPQNLFTSISLLENLFASISFLENLFKGGRADNEPCQSIPLTQERSWTEGFRRTTLAFAFGEGFALAALSLDCLVCLVLDLS